MPDPRYGDFNLQIYVYTANGGLKGVAANVIGADVDTFVIRGAGNYYLTINTAQPYEMIVEASR